MKRYNKRKRMIWDEKYSSKTSDIRYFKEKST